MTKAISSYPVSKQQQVISRRLQGHTHGAGYWAAKDATHHINPNIATAFEKIKEVPSKESAFMQDMNEANADE